MIISVIIPVYGTEKYLEKCLDSVINQNLKNIEIEIIVINDASQDNSIEIIKEYMKKDKRIILINKEKNEGLSSARNSGIKRSTGKYLFHLDSDDWIDRNCLQELCNLTKDNPDMIIADYCLDYDNGKKKYLQGQPREINNNISCIKNICYSKAVPYISGKLIKRDLYIKNNILHIDGVNLGEDLAVILRLLFFSNKVKKLNKSFYHYFQNSQSITKKETNIKNIEDIVQVLDMNREFFLEKYSDLLPEIDTLYFNHLSRHLLNSKLEDNVLYEEKLKDALNLVKKIQFKNLSKLGKLVYIFRTHQKFYILKKIYHIYLKLKKI